MPIARSFHSDGQTPLGIVGDSEVIKSHQDAGGPTGVFRGLLEGLKMGDNRQMVVTGRMNGLVAPYEGKVVFEGLEMNAKNAGVIRAKETMVFQQFELFPHLSVLENITLAPVCLHHLSKEEANVKALALLKQVGLLEKADAMTIKPLKRDLSSFSKIIVVTPLWVFRMASPVRAFVKDNQAILRRKETIVVFNHFMSRLPKGAVKELRAYLPLAKVKSFCTHWGVSKETKENF